MPKSIIGVPAKRGDIFVYKIFHKAVYLDGRSTSRSAYVFGEVESASRDGRVKKFRRFYGDGGGHVEKELPARLWMISARLDKEALRKALSWDTEFANLDEVREFARKFVCT